MHALLWMHCVSLGLEASLGLPGSIKVQIVLFFAFFGRVVFLMAHL